MLEEFARYPLTFGPTHIEKSERLSRRLSGRVEVCAGREDCNWGLAFGGNKLRKLEYTIPDAIASNADTLVSIGGVQSKSARAGRTRSQAWSRRGKALYDTGGCPLCTNMAGSALGREIDDDDIVLIEDYAHPAYGIPADETKEAIRLCARLEGMITDPVHEGKSMQGMIDLVAMGFFPAGSKVLYAHLGGAPAINGYAYAFRYG